MISKRGLSEVITVLILVGITMAAALIIWSVINSLLENKLDEAKSCAGNFDKVTINNRYTCYNSTSDRLQFSISIGDIDIDSVIVGVSASGTTKSYKLNNSAVSSPDLIPYPSGSGTVKLPGKNSGSTYLTATNSYPTSPDAIEILPVINEKQCEVADSLDSIDDCSAFA